MNPIIEAKVVGYGVDPEAYHQNVERTDPEFAVSASQLKEINLCPARWIAGYEPTSSKAKDTGNLLDTMFLSPDMFEERYIIMPETYPAGKTHAKVKKGEICEGDPIPWNANATWCKEWMEEVKDSGKETVKPRAVQDADAAISKLHSDPEIKEMIHLASTQCFVTGIYEDQQTGLRIPVKALIDLVPEKDSAHGKFLIDYKTARSGNYDDWTKAVFKYGYHVQAAFHSDIYKAATGEDRPNWGHIIQENFAPWHVEKRILSEEFIGMGRNTYMLALAMYAKARATGDWPGYAAEQTYGGWDIIQPQAWMAMSGIRAFGNLDEIEDEEEPEKDDLIP